MRVDHRYDVSPAALFEVLVDESFLRARNERYGGVGTPVVHRNDDGVEVRSVRQLPLEHVPSAFRRFVGDGRVEQIDRWRPPAQEAVAGRWELATGRAPIDLHGTHAVDAEAGGCVYAVVAEIRVSVPVVAGRLARQVESYLGQLITAEQKFLADWLAAR